MISLPPNLEVPLFEMTKNMFIPSKCFLMLIFSFYVKSYDFGENQFLTTSVTKICKTKNANLADRLYFVCENSTQINTAIYQ